MFEVDAPKLWLPPKPAIIRRADDIRKAHLNVQQLIGFGAGGSAVPISVVDDGDSRPTDSGSGGNSPYNFGSLTSAGPHVVAAFWVYGSGTTINITAASWNGNAGSLLASIARSSGTAKLSAALFGWAGGQSGDLILTYSSQAGAGVACTRLSLTNLLSLTAIDTDSGQGSAGSSSASALATPGVGGIRILIGGNRTNSGYSFDRGVEFTDTAAGGPTAGRRAAGMYEIGDTGAAIGMTHGNDDYVFCGVSLR